MLNETGAHAPSKPDARYRELTDRLAQHGCAFGQVTRELAENTREDYARLEAKINVILIGIFASPFAAAFLNSILHVVPGQ
jgi:hypothetical protein